ncbi:MAG: metal-sulfur cluster assembly factor [Bacteroidetes bacterium]|nr:metal-sulfur cluster assembly factor [Bacteroidota bacterium]
MNTNHPLKCRQASEYLMEVLDPEIGLNIIDLGLVYNINFNELTKEIFVNMTLTSQFCPMGESILGGAEEKLKNGFPDYTINVSLTFEPVWSYERISETGRAYLNLLQ